MAPLHSVGQNPHLALHRDLELIEHLERLGYDEVWIGEHHSAGYELVASPEVFIASAAERTRHIKLGTGVSSLPYHHPLMLADRIVLLDHLTRGRTMFGVGPGALTSDAYMMGLPTDKARQRMEESLEVILRLFKGERVSVETEWFTLREACLQLLPYSDFDVAVAAGISPAGPRAAGRFGLGLLSVGATTTDGVDMLAAHWDVVEERAAQFGTAVSRDKWRLVGPMHLAETEEQARADVQLGLRDWLEYFKHIAALPFAPNADSGDEKVDAMNESGIAVIGTPDQAVAQIQRLVDQSAGGFGTFLLVAHDWANWEATLRSYDLFARYVAPLFQGSTVAPVRSREWVAGRPEFMAAAGAAIVKAIGDHQAEREARQPG
jgi:limonene 1,2-monooxygenase